VKEEVILPCPYNGIITISVLVATSFLTLVMYSHAARTSGHHPRKCSIDGNKYYCLKKIPGRRNLEENPILTLESCLNLANFFLGV
jgi:hypothetical protein